MSYALSGSLGQALERGQIQSRIEHVRTATQTLLDAIVATIRAGRIPGPKGIELQNTYVVPAIEAYEAAETELRRNQDAAAAQAVARAERLVRDGRDALEATLGGKMPWLWIGLGVGAVVIGGVVIARRRRPVAANRRRR